MSKTALITGIFGQDGTLLTKSLLNKGYRILGLVRSGPENKYFRDHFESVTILKNNLSSYSEVINLFKSNQIDECFHLAACHHESIKSNLFSLEQDSLMVQTNFESTKNLIHAILETGSKTKFFYAGSSQMFSPSEFNQSFDEKCSCNPSTFYGHTKVFSANLIDYYRKNHNFYGVTGILFNHESPLRSPKFISRLITKSCAQIAKGQLKKLEVRNPYGVTDWSSAKDFVEGFQQVLSQESAGDYIFSSGTQHKVMDLIEICFNHLKLDINEHLSFPQSAKTPDVSLIGDNTKLKSTGWEPKYSFKEFILEMLEEDLKSL